MILAVSMPDCTYQGPVLIEEGEVSLSLTLNGLGESRVLVVELEEGHTFDELEAHLDESENWEDRPPWLRPVIDIELSDAQGIEGTSDTSRLGEGEYAVVCVDQAMGEASAASPLRVRGS